MEVGKALPDNKIGEWLVKIFQYNRVSEIVWCEDDLEHGRDQAA